MASPTLLQVGGTFDDAIPTINQNFDDAIQNIRDLGANQSTTLVIPLTVPATSVTQVIITLTSIGTVSSSAHQVYTQKPVSTVSGLQPLLDLYVDTDGDAAHLFPNGASLTSGQLSVFPIVTVQNTAYADSVGAWLIQLNNRDSGSHTYYLHTACTYFPTGATGVFR